MVFTALCIVKHHIQGHICRPGISRFLKQLATHFSINSTSNYSWTICLNLKISSFSFRQDSLSHMLLKHAENPVHSKSKSHFLFSYWIFPTLHDNRQVYHSDPASFLLNKNKDFEQIASTWTFGLAIKTYSQDTEYRVRHSKPDPKIFLSPSKCCKGTENRKENIIMPWYTSMVCPHLEYGGEFWSPHVKKDAVELEKDRERQQR